MNRTQSHKILGPLAGVLLLGGTLCCKPSPGNATSQPGPTKPPAQTEEIEPKVESGVGMARSPAGVSSSEARSQAGTPATQSEPNTTDPSIPADSTKPGKHGKVSAPASVNLTSSGTSGSVELTLAVQLTGDVPRVVGRFVLPAGVELASGSLEQDFGALTQGEQREMRVTVSIPDQGSFVVAAGVDLHLSRGVKLHQGDVLRLP